MRDEWEEAICAETSIVQLIEIKRSCRATVASWIEIAMPIPACPLARILHLENRKEPSQFTAPR